MLEDVSIGDSISVNGVCLTVTDFGPTSFEADVMPETFRKTNLHLHAAGTRVNLERAMALEVASVAISCRVTSTEPA